MNKVSTTLQNVFLLTILIIFCATDVMAETTFEFACEDIGTAFNKKIKKSRMSRIAVSSLTLKKKQNGLGDSMAECIEEYLSDNANDKYEVLDRANTDKIVKEWMKEIDGEYGNSVGESASLSTADAIVIGKIRVRANSVKFNVKLLDFSTGRTLASSSKEIWKTSDIVDMLDE
jgi:hypothetical protein